MNPGYRRRFPGVTMHPGNFGFGEVGLGSGIGAAAGDLLTGKPWLNGNPAGGMSISGGKLRTLNSSPYSDFRKVSIPFVSGKYYEVAFTMSEFLVGSVRPEFRGGTQRNGTVRSGNQLYTERLLANVGNNEFALLLTGDPGVNTWAVNETMTVTGPYNTAVVGGP